MLVSLSAQVWLCFLQFFPFLFVNGWEILQAFKIFYSRFSIFLSRFFLSLGCLWSQRGKKMWKNTTSNMKLVEGFSMFSGVSQGEQKKLYNSSQSY